MPTAAKILSLKLTFESWHSVVKHSQPSINKESSNLTLSSGFNKELFYYEPKKVAEKMGRDPNSTSIIEHCTIDADKLWNST